MGSYLRRGGQEIDTLTDSLRIVLTQLKGLQKPEAFGGAVPNVHGGQRTPFISLIR